MSMVSPQGRLSFPKLWKPDSFVRDDGTMSPSKYECTLLFPPNTDLGPLRAMILGCLRDKFEDDADFESGRYTNPIQKCEKKGHLAGYEPGWHYVKFSRNASMGPPSVIRKTGGQLFPITEDEHLIQPGYWCKVSTQAFAYDHKMNKGVSLGLNAVLLVKRDESFGAGAVDVESEFANVSDDFAYEGTAPVNKVDNVDDFSF